MCEYCGCQALAAIGELTREHDIALELAGRARAAAAVGDVARAASAARQIAAVLRPHTEVEEGGLFPALAAEFPEQIARLRVEHRRIEQAVSGAYGSTWLRSLVEALDVLREHILKEQDGVFPAALASLSSADWEAVGEVRSRVGTALGLAAPGTPATG